MPASRDPGQPLRLSSRRRGRHEIEPPDMGRCDPHLPRMIRKPRSHAPMTPDNRSDPLVQLSVGILPTMPLHPPRPLPFLAGQPPPTQTHSKFTLSRRPPVSLQYAAGSPA